MELIAVTILTGLMEMSELLQANGGLLFFSSLFAIIWVTGIIIVLRRWEGN
jgi:hypothetical protein